MTPDQLESLRELCNKYRITFNGRRSSSEWPEPHVGLFTNVAKLGDTHYNVFAKSKESPSLDEPWEAQIINRANRLVEIAEKCRRERRNEAGWRSALEPEIFSRFAVEVACPKCRARIWRSEIEVAIESNNLEGQSLEERRKRRKPCQCPPGSRKHDLNDTGLNPLFSDRVEELVEHEEAVRLALARREHPDRVYGLRKTTVFEDALCRPSSQHTHANGGPKLVNEAIKITPFKRKDGEPLLFPFLILEAKSAKGDDFDSMQKQTAFPIRTLLKMQADLQDLSGKEIAWQGGPLVWFLYNRGEDWRVAACFVEDNNGEASYCIFDLWNGVLLSKDGALQLLLIIDHIFDWARDIYRPAILRHLLNLGGNDAGNTIRIAQDSDIQSLNNQVRTWISRTQSVAPLDAMDIDEDTLGIVRSLRNLDSANGVFRHVSFVDSEFLGIHITGDNASTLLQVADTPQKARDFARKLLKTLLNRKSIKLTEKTLNELEHMWTKGASHLANSVAPAMEFSVRLLLTWSLSNDWNQVRELSYLAATQEGLDVLVARAELKRHFQQGPYSCSQQNVKDIRNKLFISATRGLAAAIARKAVSLEIGLDSYGTRSEQLVLMENKKDQAHGLIHEIYKKHKVGMREPDETFIRMSARIDEQTLEQAPPPRCTLRSLDEGNPLDPYRNEIVQYIIIFGRCAQLSYAPEVCCYKISGPTETPKALDMRTGLQQNLHPNRTIYNTTRYAKLSYSTDWNFSDFRQPLAERQRNKLHSWIAHLSKIGNRSDGPPPSPMDNSKASTPSTAGACPSKRKIPSSTTHGEAQHREIRNKSQSTPTRRGNGSASEKTQRSPTVVDLTEDDGPGLHADIVHLCKKLCTEFTTHIQRKQDVYHSTIMADAPDPADANIFEDAEELLGSRNSRT